MTSIENKLMAAFFGVSLMTSSCVAMAAVDSDQAEFCRQATEAAVLDILADTPLKTARTPVQHRDFPGRGYQEKQPDLEIMEEMLHTFYNKCMMTLATE